MNSGNKLTLKLSEIGNTLITLKPNMRFIASERAQTYPKYKTNCINYSMYSRTVCMYVSVCMSVCMYAAEYEKHNSSHNS